MGPMTAEAMVLAMANIVTFFMVNGLRLAQSTCYMSKMPLCRRWRQVYCGQSSWCAICRRTVAVMARYMIKQRRSRR